jgi:arylsulfatase A-like enzyme
MLAACGRTVPSPASGAGPRNLLLITIDTLRADHVGAYGYAAAPTSALDALAARGVRFDSAFAPAPITLPSHASLLTGRYPPGHGARDNGMRVRDDVPVLAGELQARGFATAAFVAAFPLDRRFGLARGFDVYDDHLPRGTDGRATNERPGRVVVDAAIAWLRARPPDRRFFVWVHLFEPHAPYGASPQRGSAIERYDAEIATADREIGRLLAALGSTEAETLVVAAGDHGEAFGEHGELAHSLFVYDTTLRVPLVFAGAGLRSGVVRAPVSLIDVPATVMARLSLAPFDTDGVDLSPAMAGRELPRRDLYAESFAPLVEFGWAALRSVRSDRWKLIAGPEPELYDYVADPGELKNLRATGVQVVRELSDRAARFSGSELPASAGPTAPDEARARLGALGYVSGGAPDRAGARPDPKARRALARRLAQITSGELEGGALRRELELVLAEDPRNPQAHLRLGALLADSGDCRAAEPHLREVTTQRFPSADPYIVLATCAGRRGDLRAAGDALEAAQRIEPGNPVVTANLGVLQLSTGALDAARESFERAVQIDPEFNEARFNLARVYGRLGRRADAAREAAELLRRLPPDAPQRPEVERLLAAVR